MSTSQDRLLSGYILLYYVDHGRSTILLGLYMSSAERNNHLAPTDVVHGQKVYLRLPRVDELSFIRTLWGDPDTMAPVGGPADFPETKAREWFARMVQPGDPSNCYCLVYNQEDAPVGEVSFHGWDSDKQSANLNIKILSACRGQGYAKDALRAFLKFFFVGVAGRMMSDDVALTNQAGRQLLESVGFRKDDAVLDVCWMSMTRRMYFKEGAEPDKPDSPECS